MRAFRNNFFMDFIDFCHCSNTTFKSDPEKCLFQSLLLVLDVIRSAFFFFLMPHHLFCKMLTWLEPQFGFPSQTLGTRFYKLIFKVRFLNSCCRCPRSGSMNKTLTNYLSQRWQLHSTIKASVHLSGYLDMAPVIEMLGFWKSLSVLLLEMLRGKDIPYN